MKQHIEENETALDEASETPEMRQQEIESGEEMHSGGANVSEEFQAMCQEILKSGTKEELDYLEELIDRRKNELSDSDAVTTDDYEAVKQGDEE